MPDKARVVLGRAGLEVVGALGAGADGIRWAVRDAAGDRWAATVLPRPAGGEGVRLRNRAARLAAVSHPHLVRVGPVVELPGGGLVVLQQEVRGADLRTVRAGRGEWSAGEVVTVVVPVAEALAVLHAAGLAHGDVAPGNVVIDADGRPVLVDVVCSDGPTERGTPGFAAPERAEGVSAAGDVYALGRVGLWLAGDDADAWSGDEVGRLHGCLTAAAAAEPRERPSAADLARDVYAACPPEPVRLPEPAVLAQLALRRVAGGDDLLTERAPPRPRGRHRGPRGHRPALVAAVVVLGAVVCVATVGLARGGLATDRAAAADGRPTTEGIRPVAPLDVDPVAAAVRLTVARAEALAAGDTAGLARVTVPGSSAAVADRRAAARLGGVSGSAAVVVHAVARRPGCPEDRMGGMGPHGGCVRVELAAWVGAVGASSGADEPEGAPPDGAPAAPRRVVLVLRATVDGWRVSEVEPAAP